VCVCVCVGVWVCGCDSFFVTIVLLHSCTHTHTYTHIHAHTYTHTHTEAKTAKQLRTEKRLADSLAKAVAATDSNKINIVEFRAHCDTFTAGECSVV
jgi:hypothetical protein